MKLSKRYVDIPGAFVARKGQVFNQRQNGDKHWLEVKNPDGTIENYATVEGRLVKKKEEPNANKRTE